MFEQIISLLTFFAIVLAAHGLGRPLTTALRLDDGPPLSRFTWNVAIGLALAGAMLTLLGLMGALHVPLLGVVTLAGGFWGIGDWARDLARRERLAPTFETSDDEATPGAAISLRWKRAIVSLSWIAALGAGIGALAPPTAGDALCYHLELPKTFLREHGIVFLPDSDNSTFPLLSEMWYAWALALDGPVTAQLLHWGMGALLALAAMALAEPILGRGMSWAVACVVLLTPGISNQMTAPLNDLALAAFTTLALSAILKGVAADSRSAWFAIAGLMLGAALATKYVAILFCAALVPWSLWRLARFAERRRAFVRGALISGAIAACFAGPWYLRAAWYRGNPVWPFFEEQFSAEAADSLPDAKAVLGRGPLALIKAPWEITMSPERFGGRGHQLGPLFLATLPVLVFARRLRGLGALLAISACYGVGWILLRQNARFLFPLVPLLAVGVVWIWSESRRLPLVPRRVFAVATGMILLAGAGLPVWRARGQVAAACGWESRDNYLARREPCYEAACVANRLIPPSAHILSQEQRAFYFQPRVIRESAFRRRVAYSHKLLAPDQLSEVLKSEGITHVLLAQGIAGPATHYNSILRVMVDDQLKTKAADRFVPLVEYVHTLDGASTRYRLYELR